MLLSCAQAKDGKPAMAPAERAVAVRTLVAGEYLAISTNCSSYLLLGVGVWDSDVSFEGLFCNIWSMPTCCARLAATGTRGVDFALGAAVAEVVRQRAWTSQRAGSRG